MTGVTEMGPVSAVRPSVQWSGTSPSSGGNESGGPAAANGARAERAAAADLLRAVAPAHGAAGGDAARERPADPGFAVESARARALAAQRAYEMASLVAGLNPLNDPLG